MIFGRKIADFIKKKFYPPRCIFCYEIMPDDVKICICNKCAREITRVSADVCPICGMETELGASICYRCSNNKIYFDTHRSVYYYKDLVRISLIRLKFKNKPQFAKTMGIVMSSYLPFNEKMDFISYVPMTVKAKKRRGYNQSELLASEIANYTSASLIETLIKVKENKRQSTLKRTQRANNIKSVFQVSADVKGKSIVLVDDIYTTGATMNECSRLLKRAGANKVFCLTFAMTKENK